MIRGLLPVLLLASGLQAAPARLQGADRLLEAPVTAAGLFPAALARACPDSLEYAAWLGLSGCAALLNDDLGLADYNRYAGSYLDQGERRELLDLLGNSLALHGRFEHRPLALAWHAPGTVFQRPWTLGLGWHQQGIARAGLDARVLRTLFFGNEPGEPVVVRDAGVRALVLSRWQLTAAVEDPAGLFPGWAFGIGLGLQKGQMARSRRFTGRLEPPQGSLAGHFEHLLDTAERGRGWCVDIGGHWSGRTLQTPVQLDWALRGVVNRIRWGGLEEHGTVFTIEPTPLSSRFDADAFELALVDSSWTRPLPGYSESLPPTLELGLTARLSPRWHCALDGVFTPARGPHPGQRRLSLYGRHHLPAVRGLSLGAELASGQGRGLGVGVDLGWQSRPLPSAAGLVFDLGLALQNQAGLFYHSRGVGLGITGGITF